MNHPPLLTLRRVFHGESARKSPRMERLYEAWKEHHETHRGCCSKRPGHRYRLTCPEGAYLSSAYSAELRAYPWDTWQCLTRARECMRATPCARMRDCPFGPHESKAERARWRDRFRGVFAHAELDETQQRWLWTPCFVCGVVHHDSGMVCARVGKAHCAACRRDWGECEGECVGWAEAVPVRQGELL